MNAIGLSILIALAGAILLAPRRWALVAMMAGVIYLTQAQEIDVLGVHLFAVRLLEIAGLIRAFARREVSALSIGRIDLALGILYAFTTTVFLLRSERGQAYAIGVMVDVTSSYLIFRCLLREVDDFDWLLGWLPLLLFPFVLVLAREMMTHKNPFAVIGGLTFVDRGGRIRCMGSFRHPALLGTLGAAFLPTFVSLIMQKRSTIGAVFGLVLCLSIVVLSNSGGPISATVVGLVCWLFWVARERMAQVRWALVGIVLTVAAVMKAPIWYLPAKVSAFSGGDGWHRSFLMDSAFRHIGRWWMFGMDISDTRDWFPYQVAATGAADITNQFIAFGLDAGVVAIALFVATLVCTFGVLGQSMAVVRSWPRERAGIEFTLWGLGCAMVVHIATWLGITYNFDQTYCIWTLQLAAVGSIAESVRKPRVRLPDPKEKTYRTGIRRVGRAGRPLEDRRPHE